MPPFPLPVRNLDIVSPRDTNDCGECTACCDVIGVQELGKPSYARCPHLNCNCTIYETRPQGCRNYRCVWHHGLLGDRPDWRPDKLGLLFDMNSDATGTRIAVCETVPGALAANAGRLKHMIDRLRSHRAMKNVVYARIWLRLCHYGVAIRSSFPIAPLYGPSAQPHEDPQAQVDRAKGEVILTGPVRGLLMPTQIPSPEPSTRPRRLLPVTPRRRINCANRIPIVKRTRTR